MKTEFKQCAKCGCMKNIKIGNTICIKCEKEMNRKEDMYICCEEQGFSATWNGMIAFDLGVVIKIQKILDVEDSKNE